MTLALGTDRLGGTGSASQPPEAKESVRRTVAMASPPTGRLVLATLLGAGAVAGGVGLMATSAWLISRASQRPSESVLAVAIVGVQFFGLSRGFFRYGERLVAHDAAFRLLADLRVRFYERLERLAPLGLPEFKRGDLLARMVQDVDSLQDITLRVIPPFGIAFLVGSAAVALVWWILPPAGGILLGLLLVSATAVPWLTGRLARRSEARQAAARGALSSAVVELAEAAPELVAYGAVDRQLARVAAADSELTRIARASGRTAGIGLSAATGLAGLAMWGALAVGTASVGSGHMDGVLLAVVALVPLAAFELVADLPAATQALSRVRRAAARLCRLLDAPEPVPDPARPSPVPEGLPALRARSLRARYSHDGAWVLDGVDLDLVPGRRVAVVGRSGAGKSTLAAVLVRFLPYQHGRVMLGPVAIEDLSGDDLRKVVGIVAQDAHVFAASIEENLRLARRDAGAADIVDALRVSRLEELVERLPMGLSTEAGEDGADLSGGERGRLAVARACLADFPVLVLDEPGEHLDAPTGDSITADLLSMSPRSAVLLITHRLAGLEGMDEVMVLDKGRVVERGCHADLLRRGGWYRRLWETERRQEGS
jgi:thiol reductant ABC exporter CydC subunit